MADRLEKSDQTHVKRLDSSGKITSYFPALTGFRTYAALLVFINHFYGHWYPSRCVEWYQTFFAYSGGRAGVTLFFALSGFLITKIYYDRFARGEIGFGEYWLRRFSRIFPPFLFLLMFKTIAAYFGEGEWHDQLYHPQYVWQILSNLTLTHAFFPKYIWTGLSPSWSLTVEECFYLCAPLVFIGLSKLQNLKQGALFLLVVSLGFWGLGEFLHGLRIGNFLYDYELTFTFNIFGKFGIFAAGVFGGLWILKKESVGRLFEWYETEFVFILGIFLIGLYQWILFQNRFLDNKDLALWARVDLLGAFGAIVFILGVVRGSRLANFVFGNPVIEYFGRISYITYLLGESFFAYYICGRVNDFTPWYQGFWASYAAFLLVSALIYECVEKPIHRRLLSHFV